MHSSILSADSPTLCSALFRDNHHHDLLLELNIALSQHVHDHPRTLNSPQTQVFTLPGKLSREEESRVATGYHTYHTSSIPRQGERPGRDDGNPCVGSTFFVMATSSLCICSMQGITRYLAGLSHAYEAAEAVRRQRRAARLIPPKYYARKNMQIRIVQIRPKYYQMAPSWELPSASLEFSLGKRNFFPVPLVRLFLLFVLVSSRITNYRCESLVSHLSHDTG